MRSTVEKEVKVLTASSHVSVCRHVDCFIRFPVLGSWLSFGWIGCFEFWFLFRVGFLALCVSLGASIQFSPLARV